MAWYRNVLPLVLMLQTGCAGASTDAPMGVPTFTVPGGPYKDLGQSSYGAKPLLGTDGEFDQLSVAPSGKRVAFVGRESSQAYELFTADIDGAIRKVGSTGLSPLQLTWSTDETTIAYVSIDPALAGRPVAINQGRSLHAMTLAAGQDRQLLDLDNRLVCYVAPTLDHAAVYGGPGAGKVGAPFTLFDLPDGNTHALTGDIPEVYRYDQVSWRPDGKCFVLSGGTRPLRFAAPDWQPTPIGSAPGTFRYRRDGRTLVSYDLTDGLMITSIPDDGGDPTAASIPLTAPPTEYSWVYGNYGASPVLESPNCKRLVLNRFANSTRPRVSAVEPPYTLPPENLLIDLDTKAATKIADGLTPVAWLDDKRLLVYAGKDQAKRLSIVTL